MRRCSCARAGGQPLGGELAEQVMGEPVAVRRVVGEHAGAHRFAERCGDLIGCRAGHTGHQARGEPLARHRGRAQDRRALLGELGEPLVKRLPDAWRQPARAALQQPGKLLHKEGVAAGPPVHLGA